MNEDRHQVRNRQSLESETDLVTLTRVEYESLKSFERKLLHWEKIKLAIIWIVVIIFVMAMIKSINTTTLENQTNNVKFDAYYENEFERARKQALNSNKRPGRIYHRGGSYGRN